MSFKSYVFFFLDFIAIMTHRVLQTQNACNTIRFENNKTRRQAYYILYYYNTIYYIYAQNPFSNGK